MWRGTRRQFSSPIVLLGANSARKAIFTLAFAGISGVYSLFFDKENKNQNNELNDQLSENAKPDFEKLKTSIGEFVFNQTPGITDKQLFMDFIRENFNDSKPSKNIISVDKSNFEAINTEKDANTIVSFDNDMQGENKSDKIDEISLGIPENISNISEVTQAEPQKNYENRDYVHNQNFTTNLEKNLQNASIINYEDIRKLISSSIEKNLQKLKEDLEKDHTEKELRNINIFFEKSQEIKRNYKEKLKEVIKKHEEEMQIAIKQRDHDWEERIEKEVTDAETHIWKQAKIDEAYTIQQTTLELIEKHEKEIRQINEKFEAVKEEHLRQLNEMLAKINELESSQKQHYKIINKLNQIHELHIHVENLQRKVHSDKESLRDDLFALKELAKDDKIINPVLESIDDVYKEITENGISTISQLQKDFNTSYQNISKLDDNNSVLLLKEAESALERGDLKAFTQNLESLKGLSQEEFNKILKDATLRQRFLNFLENLSSVSISLVTSLTSQ